MTTPALLSAAPGPVTNRDTAGKQRSDRLVVSETFTQLGGRTLSRGSRRSPPAVGFRRTVAPREHRAERALLAAGHGLRNNA